METKTKVYLPKTYIKARETQFGELLSMNITDVGEFKKFLDANTDAKGSIRFTINKSKEVSQYGNTHNAFLDTYVVKEVADSNDLPF